MAKKPQDLKPSERVTIFKAVNNTLTFFVLIVLLIEAVLGGVVLTGTGQVQLIALYGMLIIIVLLIGIVSFFAFQKPDALIQTDINQRKNPKVTLLEL